MILRNVLLFVVAVSGCVFAKGKEQPAWPTEFEIGRHTWIDIGPPNDFYELIFVRPSTSGTSIEKITLTPAADACIQPAKIEVTTGFLGESVGELLGKRNPCTIPEKQLNRRRKRCKHCLIFSGANVTMQFQCGSHTRVLRADIFDRDMFDTAPDTPRRTSWTMKLLSQIDQVTGSGVMYRPLLNLPMKEENNPAIGDSGTLRAISEGKYDDLFKGAPDKPSDLYRAARTPPPVSIVRLVSSSPFKPEFFVQPDYPPLAKLARIEGTVSFDISVNSDGSTTDFRLESGSKYLVGATETAVRGWKFPKGAAGQRVHAALEFETNCPARK